MQLGFGHNLTGGTQTTNGSMAGTSSTTPTFDARGNAIIDQLQNSTLPDVNTATQSAIAAQNAKTNSELGSVLAGVKSGGYGRATNWGQGNVAQAAANVLAQRDLANANLQAQAAQQSAQNQLAQNQNLAVLLSMLRGESSTQAQSSKQKTNNFGWGQYGNFKAGM